MTRPSFFLRSLVMLLALAAALGCGKQTGTSTGNPHSDPVVPAGVTLVKSDLERETPAALSPSDASALGSGNRAFAFELYAELSKADGGNLFFSPYSISVALAMTYAGANTTTEAEMKNALHFELEEPALHQALNATSFELEKRATELPEGAKGDGFELSIVNQAWAQDGKTFLPEYLDVLAQSYGAGVFELDFGKSDDARETINGWVEDQTHDRIVDLLPEGSITGDTVLVLTNAIYFKASWEHEFQEALTKDETFHAPGGDRTVSMMHNTYEGMYMLGDGYQVVSLPYVSPQTRMLVIVPDDGAFDATSAALDDTLFRSVLDGMSKHEVVIGLPKFSFESAPTMKEPLMALGMPEAFGGDADFSGLDGAKGLYIQDVVHKAFVAVDEEGTEAAAATAVIIGETSAPILPHAEVVIDRPFLFAIYDDPTGQILFLGRVMDPS